MARWPPMTSSGHGSGGSATSRRYPVTVRPQFVWSHHFESENFSGGGGGGGAVRARKSLDSRSKVGIFE